MYDKKLILLLIVVGLCSGVLSAFLYRLPTPGFNYLPGIIFGLSVAYVFSKRKSVSKIRAILFVVASTGAWYVAAASTWFMAALTKDNYFSFLGGIIGGFLFLRFFSSLIQKISYGHIFLGTLVSGAIGALGTTLLDQGYTAILLFAPWQIGMATMMGAWAGVEATKR